jgi:DNA-binding MarR family transcriptional regulator
MAEEAAIHLAPTDLQVDDAVAAKAALSHEFLRYGRVIHLFRTQLADLLPAGLDPAAAQLLAWLVKQGPSRQGELADNTFLDPSTVSRRISQLVHLGLVERRADPVDGRAVQLVPTAQGQKLFTSIKAHREQIMREVLAGWSSADLSALTALLGQFNDDFESYRAQLNVHSPPA